MARKRRPALIKSIRALARRLGRAEATVRKWLRTGRWPAGVPQAGPWSAQHLARLMAFRDLVLKPDAAAGRHGVPGVVNELTPEQKLKLVYWHRRNELLQQRIQTAAGKVHDVAECNERALRQVLAIKTHLLEVGPSMASTLAGQSAETIERLLTDRMRSICKEFAEGDGGVQDN